MIEQAINRIATMAEEAKNEVIKVHELRYFKNIRGVELISPPTPGSYSVNSLDSIAEYLDTPNAPDDAKNGVVIVVKDHRQVSLAMVRDKYEQQPDLIRATLDRKSFDFDTFHPIEEFIIKVQTGFVDSTEKSEVIRTVSGVRGDVVQKNIDDGISQRVSVDDKLERMEVQIVKPMWDLSPYRTFVEVEQPVSPFLLRIRKDANGQPTAALFEADCSGWKHDATRAVVAYLRNHESVKKAGVKVI